MDLEKLAAVELAYGVREGVLDSVGVGGVARGDLFECRATVS